MSDIKIELWPIGNLIPYELNSKKHPPEQVAKIAKSIENFKFDQPIVVDKHGVIIKGHGRRLGAMALGLKMVPVVVRDDLTPEQVKAARVSDNRSAISDIDSEIFKQELAQIDLDLLRGISDDKELDYLASDLGAVNDGAFVTDMAGIVSDQKKDVENRLNNVKEGRVTLAKAFGFKDISAANQIVISRVMAKAEAFTGLQGDAAFVKWADTQLQLSA